VKRRIKYEELTHSAKIELPFVLGKIVAADEQRFLEIYNKSYPITTRLHMLCLLPGIGRKMMQTILDERKRGEFKSFSELSERVKSLHHPDKIIVKRIENELKDEKSKYRLFTR
jgi:putative nucleotide binding protein